MGPDITLQPGDRVLIVSNWDNSHDFNHAGLMDKYLGTVMTIRERTPAGHYRMEEDLGEFEEGKGWFWNESMFECLVNQEEDFGINDCEMEGSLSDFFA